MLLKRHYRKDATGALLDPPQVAHLEVKHTGTTAEQHFSTRLVAAGLAEGWLSIDGQTLTLKSEPDDLVYTILRVPGKYPSDREPAGYEIIHYYDCVLNAEQHDRLRKGRV